MVQKRNSLQNEQCVLIQFKVNGLTGNQRRLQLRTDAVKHDLSVLLGVSDEIIDIEKPKGFMFRVLLRINDVFYKDLDYKSIIDRAVSDGDLAKIFERNWNVTKLTVDDVKYAEIRSDVEREILAKRVSAMMAHHSPRNLSPVAMELAEGLQMQQTVDYAIAMPAATAGGVPIQTAGGPLTIDLSEDGDDENIPAPPAPPLQNDARPTTGNLIPETPY